MSSARFDGRTPVARTEAQKRGARSNRMETICVTLKVFGGLRARGGPPAEACRLPPGSTLEHLWHELAAVDGPFVREVRKGLSDGYLHVLVNGRNAVFLEGMNTRLHDRDTVAILPPIGGG